MNNTGIYKILNKINNKFYIGSTATSFKRPIKCVTTNQEFKSIREAAKFFNLNECHLNVCLKKQKPVKGLFFIYV